MKRYTLEELKSEFQRLNYKWLEFMLVGVRSKADEPNKFDDLLILINKDNIYQFSGTTNAGTTYLQKLLNAKGCAVLIPNQYLNTWQLGLHRGKYTALVQRREVSVWRDNDKDLKSEQGVVDTGLFGINIHKANTGITQFINGHSAGCQVFQNSTDFDFVIKSCKDSELKSFTYTLLNEF